ncbi:Alpha/Beta hydrolase protein [Pisolithus croceorrhizus]|nr:Alpha/Beta hydrolase protein [Pisolithus croceorrhizus]
MEPAPYAKQPWKAVYLTFKFLLIILSLPVWAVTFLFTRPRPTWSWAQSIVIAFLRAVGNIPNAVGALSFPDYRAISPAPDAEGVWIDGVPHLITAELKVWSAVANVTPARIPGYWYAKKGFPRKPTSPIEPGQRVFLFIHGGAFTQLSAHPTSITSTLTWNLVELSDTAPHALSVEYRRSSTSPLPERHPFPAALLDVLAAYDYLVNIMGYDPCNIIVAGDSAGANIALAMTRYLVENKGTADVALPSAPGHLLLASPWGDPSNSHAIPGSATLTNDADILYSCYTGREYPSYHGLAYLGPFGLGMAYCNRYVSPASLSPFVQARFEGFPRTFIIAGGAERLLDQIRTLRDKMVKDMGANQVRYYEGTDAIHDFVIFPLYPGRFDAFKAIQEWLA